MMLSHVFFAMFLHILRGHFDSNVQKKMLRACFCICNLSNTKYELTVMMVARLHTKNMHENVREVHRSTTERLNST